MNKTYSLCTKNISSHITSYPSIFFAPDALTVNVSLEENCYPLCDLFDRADDYPREFWDQGTLHAHSLAERINELIRKDKFVVTPEQKGYLFTSGEHFYQGKAAEKQLFSAAKKYAQAQAQVFAVALRASVPAPQGMMRARIKQHLKSLGVTQANKYDMDQILLATERGDHPVAVVSSSNGMYELLLQAKRKLNGYHFRVQNISLFQRRFSSKPSL